jgi:NADPH-dependent 2,4-dienoyl-CoA reductase/sulfur reductase-like enzyme
MALERIVIIGAGQAGGRAAEALRVAGFKGEVLLLGDEAHEPYERPALSKGVLLGEEPAARTLIHPREWYAAQKIELRSATRVEAIAPVSQTVITAQGERIEYSRLLLCTGSRVRPLAGANESLRGVHYLRTIGDSERLAAELRPGRRIVIIGGGFIGLEVASSAAKRGLAVRLVERQGALLDRALPAEIAALVESFHRSQGVQMHLGVPVARIHGRDAVESVELADGTNLEADLVVVGIGIIPNTELAEAAGAASSDGIVVDEYCRTNVANLYAAGDATNHYNPLLERRIRLESWQNAQNQAVAAAHNLSGSARPYAEIPWFWSDQFGRNIQMVGIAEPGLEVSWRGEPRSGRCMAFGLRDGRVRLAVAFDLGAEIRHARRLIESRVPVPERRLIDPQCKLKDLLPDKAARPLAA